MYFPEPLWWIISLPAQFTAHRISEPKGHLIFSQIHACIPDWDKIFIDSIVYFSTILNGYMDFEHLSEANRS